LCRIVREPIDIVALERAVSNVENGAVVTFVGQVRVQSRGREVSHLEYDAYEPMAVKMMDEIAASPHERWGVDIQMEPWVGRLGRGERSVVVCVGPQARGAAFEACRYCIDRLKETVPIWKKEVCPDGAFWIEGEQALPAAT